MGYYIQTGSTHHKAEVLIIKYGASLIERPPASLKDLPPTQALIVVVNNGAFEAAGLVYDDLEFKEFTKPDVRPRQYLLMDKAIAHKLTGYKEGPEVVSV